MLINTQTTSSSNRLANLEENLNRFAGHLNQFAQNLQGLATGLEVSNQTLETTLGNIDRGITNLARIMTRENIDRQEHMATITDMIQDISTNNIGCPCLRNGPIEPDLNHQWEPIGNPTPSVEELPTPRVPTPTIQEVQTERRQPRDEIPKAAKSKIPEKFSGQRGTAAEQFMLLMEIYFDEYQDAFDDRRKIKIFLSHMKEDGAGAKWAKPLLTKFFAQEEHELLTSWETLKRGFLSAFEDADKKNRVLRELDALKQTGPATDYVSKFRILTEELEWDAQAKIDKFKRGLKGDVQAELLQTTAFQDESTLDLEEWMRRAIKVDNILFAARKLTNQTSTYQGRNWKSPNQERKEGNQSNTRNSTRPARIPDSTIDYRKKNKLCIKCGSKDHLIGKCKERFYVMKPSETGKAGEIPNTPFEEEESNSTSSESEN